VSGWKRTEAVVCNKEMRDSHRIQKDRSMSIVMLVMTIVSAPVGSADESLCRFPLDDINVASTPVTRPGSGSI